MDMPVLESLDDGLMTVTLNRPEARNALNHDLVRVLHEVIVRAGADPDVRAVLIEGAGESFCVGGDVKAMAAGLSYRMSHEENVAALRMRMEVSRLLHEMRKPTLAKIHGAAAGAGLAMALACDLRIAGASAKITTAFARVGLPGDFGGSYFLTRMVGAAKARELYLTSPILSGEEAHALGLVSRVVPDDELDGAARALARSLAGGPTVALGYMKQALNFAGHGSLAELLDMEAANQIRCMATDDHKEAAAAFVEKRASVFRGR